MDLRGQRIAAYARYSTDKQNPRSIEDQLRVVREYVERFGGAIGDGLVFADAAISGTAIARPGFEALQRAVRERLVDVVVTEDLSRIGRDNANNALVMREFRTIGARLIAINDNLDTGQPKSKLYASIKSAMAEEYIDEIRERTKRGMQGLHERGLHTGGRVFGYRAVPIAEGSEHKRLEIEPAEAGVVRRIFADYVAGTNQRAIAERLNEAGVPSPNGGLWGHTSVRAMLRAEIYIGRVTFNRRKWERDPETGKRRKTMRPRSEWRSADRPELRIIDAETWDAAQQKARAGEQAWKAGKRARRGYPLSGLLVCNVCSEPMTIGGGGLYYQCSGRRKGHGCQNRAALRERDIRRWLLDKIRDTAGAPSLLDAMRTAWASSLGDSDRAIKAELEQRRAALSRTRAQLSRLFDLAADAAIDGAELRGKLAEKQDHAELQRAAIARLEAELQRVPVIPSVAAIRAFLGELPDALLRRPDQARAVLGRMLVGPVRCAPPADGQDDYRVRFELALDALLETSTAPSRGRSLVVVAGARTDYERATRVVEGVCPKGYAETGGGDGGGT